MNIELMNIAYKLKETLEKDDRVLLLKQAEEKMENEEDVMRLSYAFSVAQDEYSECLRHFNAESEKAKSAQKKLYESKKELDSHPLVQDYLKKYQQVRLMYHQIQMQIFNPFNMHKCNEKR